MKSCIRMWPVWAILLTVLFAIGMVVTSATSWGDEPQSSVTRGYTDSGYVRLKSTTDSRGITTTRGTIDGKYVRTVTKPKQSHKLKPTGVGRACLKCDLPK